MKTVITEELDLPEDVRAALSREALRAGKPVSVLLHDWLVRKSESVIEAAKQGGGKKAGPMLAA